MMNKKMMMLYMKSNFIVKEYCNKAERESRPVERLEPQWDNNISYLKLRKEKKITFEDDITNMKTEMNHNLLTQIIERSKSM